MNQAGLTSRADHERTPPGGRGQSGVARCGRNTLAGLRAPRVSWGIHRILAAFIVAACTACSAAALGNRHIAGSGTVARASWMLDDFRAVELQFHGELHIEPGDTARLVIEAEDNLLQYLEPQVLDDTLVIRKMPPHVTLDATAPIRYFLTATALESLTTTCEGSIVAPRLTADRLSITVQSSGSVYVDQAHASRLQVTIQADGDVIIAGGQVEEQIVTLTSSGTYDARELASARAQVRLSSSGQATIAVRDRLDADLSSSGNLYYLGHPVVNEHDSSSEGRVVRMLE